MLTNMLEIFKAQDPRMEEFAGSGKIFFHHLCTGARVSYGVEHINRIFEEGHNVDHLQERMVSLMEGLQSRDPALYEKYSCAEEEYPDLYRLLVGGLSDQALAVIRQTDVSAVYKNEPADLGPKFVDRLLQDRVVWSQESVPASGVSATSLDMAI